MGDALNECKIDDEECVHPYRSVDKRSVNIYVPDPDCNTAAKNHKIKINRGTQVTFCTECQTVIDAENRSIDLKGAQGR